MALNVDFDVSFDNRKEWKGIGEKAGEEANSTKQMRRSAVQFAVGITLLIHQETILDEFPSLFFKVM
jgi:hypothetical protein